MSYLNITNTCMLVGCFVNTNGFNEVWTDGVSEFTCLWLNNMESTVPSTIYKKEIND